MILTEFYQARQLSYFSSSIRRATSFCTVTRSSRTVPLGKSQQCPSLELQT